MCKIEKERAIRAIVANSIEIFTSLFFDGQNLKIKDENNVIYTKNQGNFLSFLDHNIRFYLDLSKQLDWFLTNTLQISAFSIASLFYTANQSAEGNINKEQIDFIDELLDLYNIGSIRPQIADYEGISLKKGVVIKKRYESDFYLIDKETDKHYLISLMNSDFLNDKKARSEKQALLEQYCILTNELGKEENVKILFTAAYNRFGEDKPWTQGHVLQFFAKDELCSSRDFWNLVCKSERGYDIVIDEYRKNAHYINEVLNRIISAFNGK